MKTKTGIYIGAIVLSITLATLVIGLLISADFPYLLLSIITAFSTMTMLLFISINKNKQKMANALKDFEKFKASAEKLNVDLNKCELKTNNYTEVVEKKKDARIMALDALYDPSKNIEEIQVNQIMILYNRTQNGQKEQFVSPTLYIDELTLRLLLDRQKTTYLYINPKNRNDYYFDLDFLSNRV